jgi:hypothetical protein
LRCGIPSEHNRPQQCQRILKDIAMADIRKQIGLDYLKIDPGRDDKQPPGSSPSAAGLPFLDDALLAYGRPILEALRKNGPAPLGVFALVDQLAIRIDVALKVVAYLEAGGHVEVVRRDLKGNDELRLTKQGMALIAA